ncbi:hypothetical protein QBC33DRAFT_544346 [Phialemonium atrogriseum]|uniref:F-box domain-containing protein n=1 Tax=Phialemonium atrogriseum TaxID=1093897 RepID=A0AAJ0BWA5_9PEZI|nr:uncharacterized protein QBC33DRAFT_544346 [Phialemonium atrogriseum]KAK1765460.1 hypothetical protein QBC33DRAFT_544346 [Phialemonium atrogriseum]
MGSQRSSRPPVLYDLPNEVLSLILGNFCLHCRNPQETPLAYFPGAQQEREQPSWYSLDRQALYSTCLVSRTLRDIAQAILYHEFAPGYGDSWRSMQYTWEWRLTNFLRTVTLRQDLAALVRRLYLSHHLMNEITKDDVEPALEEAAQARGIQLSDFLAPFQDLWPTTIRGQYRPSTDELGAMLLACLPNLTCLTLSMMVPRNTIPMSALSAAGISSLPLETIDICGSDSNLRHRLGGILEMSFSTLRTLNLELWDGEDLRSLDLDCLLPNLRNLCITSSRLSLSDLGSLLSCCVALETFIYEAGESFINLAGCL